MNNPKHIYHFSLRRCVDGNEMTADGLYDTNSPIINIDQYNEVRRRIAVQFFGTDQRVAVTNFSKIDILFDLKSADDSTFKLIGDADPYKTEVLRVNNPGKSVLGKTEAKTTADIDAQIEVLQNQIDRLLDQREEFDDA